MYSTVEVSLHSHSGWCFEIVFWMIWVLKTRPLFNFYKKKIVWQFDARSRLTQDLQEIRVNFNISSLRI